jgi:membrane dipeptidase
MVDLFTTGGESAQMGAGCDTFEALMINSRYRLDGPFTWMGLLLGGALLLAAMATPAAPPASGPAPAPAQSTPAPASPASTPAPSDAELHRRAIVIDTHADTTQAFTYFGMDIARPQPDLDLDLPKVAAGGLDAEFFSIFVFPKAFKPADFYGEALRQIDAVERVARANPQRMRVARTAAEVRANAAAGILSALIGVEGGHVLGPGDPATQLDRLRALADRGARYMTLTWSNGNDIGGSSGDDSDVRGLTPFGRDVIVQMNRLGIIVDISHVSDPTFWDAIRATRKPVLASHSSSRALTNVPRNMTDAMLKAVGQNGGAACVNFGASFLDEAFHERESAIWAKPRPADRLAAWRQVRADGARLTPRVPLSRLIDHIEHMVKVAGVDHVCLGSDFDGMPALPVGMENVGKLPAITAALRARGMSVEDVEKILGGNVLRVMEANEH